MLLISAKIAFMRLIREKQILVLSEHLLISIQIFLNKAAEGFQTLMYNKKLYRLNEIRTEIGYSLLLGKQDFVVQGFYTQI